VHVREELRNPRLQRVVGDGGLFAVVAPDGEALAVLDVLRAISIGAGCLHFILGKLPAGVWSDTSLFTRMPAASGADRSAALSSTPSLCIATGMK
jgi:hypothetical protein